MITWQLLRGISFLEFVEEMLVLGKPLETSLVGVFDVEGRGSRRDIELPMHRDGEYSGAHGGSINAEAIKYVGLYCLREGNEPCLTLVHYHGSEHEIDLKRSDALILDNNRVTHGRRGVVGARLLIRMWVG